MSPLLLLIIGLLSLEMAAGRTLDWLNSRNSRKPLPAEAQGVYEEDRYRRSREYFRVNNRFEAVTAWFNYLLLLVLLLTGSFGKLDLFLRQYISHPMLLTLVYFGLLGLASDLIGIPFSLYRIFVIEERFGFNKMSVGTWIGDKLRSWLLAVLIGMPLLSVLAWTNSAAGPSFWWMAWMFVSVFMLLSAMFYASWILPLFNKLTPLNAGELRTAIEAYAQRSGFRLENIFVMDGSKRSSKANAFFSGLGKKKKIVLFDTLISELNTAELVAVLAHEVGHYRKKHTRWGLLVALAQVFLLFFVLSLLLGNPELAKALGASVTSLHIDLLAFGMLYAPVSLISSLAMNALSRKNELEADAFAAETSSARDLSAALRKLATGHLSNLTPHPAYVFVHYSHPPLTERLKRLNRML